MQSYRRQYGLTFIELVATLLIIAVVAAIAVPNFANMIRNDRARAQASLLADAFNYARSEAVTRGRQIGVVSSGGSNWNEGWRVFIDTNNDDVYTAGTDQDLRVQGALVGDATLQNASNSIVLFSPAGALTGAPVKDANNQVVFQFRSNSNDCRLGKDIVVNLVGRIYVDKQAGCP